MADVVTIGECMGGFFPPDPVTLDDTNKLLFDVGGAEANISIALCRLGVSARFISRVGDDPFGRRIRQVLEQEGVDTSALATDLEAPTGIFFREWLPDFARRVYYYRKGSAASRMSPEYLSRTLFEGARIVHLTGITPALSPTCAAAVTRAVELAEEVGALISFDPNYRARLWSPEQARATLLPIMKRAHVLLMGHEDAQAVFGVSDEDEILAAAVALGAQAVVLKRAERGAIGVEGNVRIEAPAHPAAHAIDPIGAGDGFDAGFLAGRLRGYDLAASLDLGARVGAACVEVLGDYNGYPRL
ncbi:MAG TPA: sugar kinase [Roseiflexaceae bacterium]|nr:sugar kinase [Roseiflexaceae bacterium]